MKKALVILGSLGALALGYATWHATRPTPIHAASSLTGPTGPSDLTAVTDLVRSPDERLLATVSDRKSVTLWDAKTGENLHVLEGNGEWFFAPAFSPDSTTLATAENTFSYGKPRGRIQFWDASTGERSSTVDDIFGPQCVKFNPAGNTIAVGGISQLLLVDVPTKAVVQKVDRPHERGALVTLAFSPSGDLLATAGKDGSVRLWKSSDLTSVHTFSVAESVKKVISTEENRGPVAAASVAFSHDNKLFAANNSEGTVFVWALDNGRELVRYAYDYNKMRPGESIAHAVPNSLAFTPDDKWLVVTDHTGTGVRLLKVSGKEELTTPLTTHSDTLIEALDATLPNGSVAIAYNAYQPGSRPVGKFEIWSLDLH